MTRIPALLGVLGVVLVACGDGKEAEAPKTTAGKTICDDHRQSLDCDSEVAYQGVKAEGNVHVLNIAGASGAFGTNALRQINDKVETYIAGQTRLCREYNSCIVKPEEYHREASEARAKLTDVGTLVSQLSTGDASARGRTADNIYAKVTNANVAAPLSVDVALDAELPASAGGASVILPQNYPLPTNARVAFKLNVSPSAFVYLFEVDSERSVGVLFPDSRIRTSNPLSPNTGVRIPEGTVRYKVDDSGIGENNVYVVASTHALPEVERALLRFQSKQAKTIDQDPLLAGFAGLQPGKSCERTRDLVLEDSKGPPPAAGECPKTRGLVLDAPPDANQQVQSSLRARASAGDDVIVKVFRYRHVPEASFKAENEAFNAPTPEGAKKRGIAVEK